jgi:hypothetical protein
MSSGKFLKVLTHALYPPMTAHSPAEEEQLIARGYSLPATPEYHEYPKTLTHPDYAPARMVSAEKRGPAVSTDYPEAAAARLYNYQAAVWEPECNPPVIARDRDEEAKFVAQGYRVVGTPSAAAFAAAQASPIGVAAEFLEYPKWMIPPEGEAVIAKSEAEERALLAKWADSKPREPSKGARA